MATAATEHSLSSNGLWSTGPMESSGLQEPEFPHLLFDADVPPPSLFDPECESASDFVRVAEQDDAQLATSHDSHRAMGNIHTRVPFNGPGRADTVDSDPIRHQYSQQTAFSPATTEPLASFQVNYGTTPLVPRPMGHKIEHTRRNTRVYHVRKGHLYDANRDSAPTLPAFASSTSNTTEELQSHGKIFAGSSTIPSTCASGRFSGGILTYRTTGSSNVIARGAGNVMTKKPSNECYTKEIHRRTGQITNTVGGQKGHCQGND
eukprot:m.30599 g.30599  ORF g.30599 m.30599 type:complete len:263 (-) comp13876_c0_seq2:1270-2058(-)